MSTLVFTRTIWKFTANFNRLVDTYFNDDMYLYDIHPLNQLSFLSRNIFRKGLYDKRYSC